MNESECKNEVRQKLKHLEKYYCPLSPNILILAGNAATFCFTLKPSFSLPTSFGFVLFEARGAHHCKTCIKKNINLM